MAIFVKVSLTRKQLTTFGLLQLCACVLITGAVLRSMQRVDIFTDDLEWQPHLETSFRESADQSRRKARDTWSAGDQSAAPATITLFTTFRDARVDDVIRRNTLANWAALKPFVTPVLFVDGADVTWSNAALTSGWEVRNITRTVKDEPVLKHMFMEIVNNYETPFYGYAKSDILFDRSLVGDMQLHVGYLKAYEKHGGLLLIGRRTDVVVDELVALNPANLSSLGGVARTNGTLSGSYLEDYFLTTRSALPWSHIPDLVVGEPGYGKWLVVKAQICNVTVIDASYTLLALRQTVKADALSRSAEIRRCINKRLVELANFDCSKGVAECAPYVSHEDKDGILKLYRRSDRPYWCAVDYGESCAEDLDRYNLDDHVSLF